LHVKAGYETSSQWEYGYCRFDNGTVVNTALRQIYLGLSDEARKSFRNPFHVQGSGCFLDCATKPKPEKRNISVVLEKPYNIRYDVSAAFPDLFGKDRDAFVNWARTQGAQEMGYEPVLVSSAQMALTNGHAPQRGPANRVLSAGYLGDPPGIWLANQTQV